jgi:D-glycero-D-manno-heptose 1,7-bisphosphate phosphatase
MTRRVVFVDRDGVILRLYIEDGNLRSARNMHEFEYLPGVIDAVDLLRRAGLDLVVVTNQPEVARGLIDLTLINDFHERLRRELGNKHIYTCFHDNRDRCQCRKPKPGLLKQAAADMGITLSASFLVGDRRKDIEAGRSIGCTTFLVRHSYSGDTCADYEVAGLFEAAQKILVLIGNYR